MNFKRFLVLFSILIYTLIYFKFYPAFYSFADEGTYVIQAEFLSKGELKFPDWVRGMGIHEGRIGMVSKYPPFYSLIFLSLPLKINFYFIFFVSLLIHLFSFFILYKILTFLNIDPLFSLLYLFHPSFILYSRTVMPDFYNSFLFLLTLYFHIKEKNISYITNFLFVLLKPPNFFYSFVFIYDSFKKRRRINLIFYILSTFISIFLIFIYLYFIYGRHHPDFKFSLIYFFKNFKDYFVYLNLNYPLLLIFGLLGILKIKILRNLLIGFLPAIFLYLLYIYHDKVERNLILSSVIGIRYLFPFLIFLIIGYSLFLQNLFKEKLKKFFFILFFLSGLFSSYLIMKKHNFYLKIFKETKELVYKYTEEKDLLVTHFEITKLLLPIWGKRETMHFTDWKSFTFYENLKSIKALPESFVLIYTLKSGEKNLSFIKIYADSVLKIFPEHILLFQNDYLYIYRVYSRRNFLPITQ